MGLMVDLRVRWQITFKLGGWSTWDNDRLRFPSLALSRRCLIRAGLKATSYGPHTKHSMSITVMACMTAHIYYLLIPGCNILSPPQRPRCSPPSLSLHRSSRTTPEPSTVLPIPRATHHLQPRKVRRAPTSAGQASTRLPNVRTPTVSNIFASLFSG